MVVYFLEQEDLAVKVYSEMKIASHAHNSHSLTMSASDGKRPGGGHPGSSGDGDSPGGATARSCHRGSSPPAPSSSRSVFFFFFSSIAIKQAYSPFNLIYYLLKIYPEYKAMISIIIETFK